MSTPAVLIATSRLRPGTDDAFVDWQMRHNETVARFAGYISCDIIPPLQAGDNEWTIIVNFQSAETLAVWQQSPERARLIADALPLLEGGNWGQVMPKDSESQQPGTMVTQLILSKVKAGMEASYRQWAVKIQQAQSKYPGYRGMYLQQPATAAGHWTTLLRFDTQEHLEAWLAAPERARLLDESKAFIENEELLRLASSFPGWIPISSVDGEAPAAWKLALLVLLGLFPVVMFELRFLSPPLRDWYLNSSLSTFIGNFISVTLTSFITMPLFVRTFAWWLFPKKSSPRNTDAKGTVILILLFAAEIGLMWNLL